MCKMYFFNFLVRYLNFAHRFDSIDIYSSKQIQRAREESEITRQDAEDEAKRLRALEDEFGDDPNQPQCKYTIKNPERVLVRLKVEHTGFTTLNNQRFGSQFVGQVVRFHDSCLDCLFKL